MKRDSVLLNLSRNGHVLTRYLKKNRREIYVIIIGSKKPFSRCIDIPNDTYRTHNRNRSLSFINSDQLANVNKGSRHNKPVTSGKRLALMVGYRGNLLN
jgi:hypothetical protein